MKKKKKEKKSKENLVSENEPKQMASRMLARCESCLSDYEPRGRGGNEISMLKLYYLPHEKLDSHKKGLICPMHKNDALPAGLILSEDCLNNQYGSAMGMLAFTFSEEEVAFAQQNQIWPKQKQKIEIDINMFSSLSDDQILKVIKQIKKDATQVS